MHLAQTCRANMRFHGLHLSAVGSGLTQYRLDRFDFNRIFYKAPRQHLLTILIQLRGRLTKGSYLTEST
jgi:hypothetical protein